jgi:hypothetical protein
MTTTTHDLDQPVQYIWPPTEGGLSFTFQTSSFDYGFCRFDILLYIRRV